jgi:hypothetical protein
MAQPTVYTVSTTHNRVGFCGGNTRGEDGGKGGAGGQRRRRDCRSTRLPRLALSGAEPGGVLVDCLGWTVGVR